MEIESLENNNTNGNVTSLNRFNEILKNPATLYLSNWIFNFYSTFSQFSRSRLYKSLRTHQI